MSEIELDEATEGKKTEGKEEMFSDKLMCAQRLCVSSSIKYSWSLKQKANVEKQ